MRHPHLPLAWVIVVPFVCVTAVAGSLVGWIFWQGEEKAVSLVVNELETTLNDRIRERLGEFLENPHEVIRINSHLIQQGILDSESPATEQFLARQLEDLPDLSWIYYGRANDGSFVAATRLTEDRSVQSFISDASTNFIGTYLIHAQGERQILWQNRPYDARERPWFQAAAQAKKSVWTDIYPSFNTGDLLMTAAFPVYDDSSQLLGVVATDYALVGISRFLRTLRVGKTGRVYIVDTTGTVVAASTDVPTFSLANDQLIRQRLQDSPDPVLAEAGQALIQHVAASGSQNPTFSQQIQVAGASYFLGMQRYQDARNLVWWVITLIPERDFLEPVWQHGRGTILLGSLAVVIAGVIGSVLGRVIVIPVTKLSQASEALAKGQWQHSIRAYGIRELTTLSRSFRDMASQLQVSYQQLQNVNGELEQRVQERTHELAEKEAIFRGIFENAPLGIVLDHVGGGLVAANPALRMMLGYDANEISQISYRDYTDPEYIEEEDELWQNLIANEITMYELEKKCIRKNGALLWMRIYVSLIHDEEGTPKYSLAIAEDITWRKYQEQFLRALIDTYPDMISVRDAQNRNIIVNQAYANFYGLQPADLIGIFETELIPEAVQQVMQAETTQVLTTQADLYSAPQIQVDCQGNAHTIRWIKRAVDRPDGQGRCVLQVGVDITQLKAAEQAEIQARQAAEAANKAKSTFLANMSHELRTPLNAIIGFSQLMNRDPHLSDKQRQTLGTILRSGEHLLELINDVLDMAKIEAGKIVLQPDPFDLWQMLETIQEMLTVRAEAKQLRLTVIRDPNLPQVIVGDEKKLRQVLINIVGNAIKFTSQGSVTLTATGAAGQHTPGDPVILSFAVSDTGLGMTPEELVMLFQAFVQTDTSKKVSEGTGLGLAISRQFVQLMGGDITVASQKGVGTTFTISIQAPLGQSQTLTQQASFRHVTGLAPDQPPYRILVVDDRPENRDLLDQLLTGIGFQVRQASDGQEAIQQWQDWDPHAIFMDKQMPVMDGLQATRHIRDHQGSRTTKIIALSASVFEQNRAEWQQAGCDDFVPKPFREQQIFEKLAQHIGVRFIQGSPTSTSGSPAPKRALTRDMLQAMPPTWIAQFHQAALALSNRKMKQLIQEIPTEQQELAEVLTLMVKKVQIDPILAMTTTLVAP
ncbi:MAG: hypothetical protein OHK0012_07180 [Synechococcales cyanobacterium]